jgi:uncharacterized membrane protein
MQFLKSILRRFSAYFIKGLLLIAPLGLTIYVVYLSVRFVRNLFPTDLLLPSILIVLFGTAFLGWLGTLLIQTPILQFIDRALERIPLVKFIYTSIRDLMSAFMGNEKRFNKPVLVRMGDSEGVYKMGFITQQNVTMLGINDAVCAVYMPHSYNFSGNLFLVESSRIKPIEASTEDVMKFIVSGGVTRI